mgnify:CR=1 FL=1
MQKQKHVFLCSIMHDVDENLIDCKVIKGPVIHRFVPIQVKVATTLQLGPVSSEVMSKPISQPS